MARNQDAGIVSRTMLEVVADATAVLREDASEYAFIGLAGGASAGIVVLTLGVIGGAVATALIAPLLLVVMAVALATSSAAVGAGANRLQPDAARALAEVGARGLATLRPWLPLAVALGGASYVAAKLADYTGPVPPDVFVLTFVAIAAAYALPRSLFCTALFEYDLSLQESVSASAAVERMMLRAVVTSWCVVLAPAILVLALGAVAGINIVMSAVAAVLLVGVMPAGASLMSTLFRDAATAANRA